MDLRLDRIATLYLVNPVQRRAVTRVSIPILMYHSVSNEAEEGVGAYFRTITSPSVFAQHMRYLHDHEYSTLSLAEAVSRLQNGDSTEKCAVITFDDGYADFARHAFPELNRYGFTATVFLPTAFIGSSSCQFKGRDCLTWSQIRHLKRSNISFGSHTVTHPQLSALTTAGVTREIVDSKQTIEDELGEPVDSFAYPYAFPERNISFVQWLRDVMIDCGYRQGVCTRIGTARRDEDQYFLRRLPINTLDDIPLFSAKLQGAYDWLCTFQSMSKLIRAKIS